MKILKLILFPVLLGMNSPSYAKLVQIIHTNDLHSFFGGSRSGMGGYSRIKTLVDQLKADAKAKGIPSLYVDGGDFGEGSSYYFSNEGVDAIKALDMLGVDATVLGNHDFFLGGDELADQLQKAEFKGQMLSANMKGKNLMKLKGRVKNFADFEIEGLKIRVFGLSTPEIHYQYPLVPKNFITSAHKAGIKMGRQAQKDDVDFLIALTHIGVDKDVKLVSKSRSIDLVVGGHSHTRLEAPRMVQNLRGESIPVVQAGAHGIAVGSIIVDIQGDSEYKLIDARLYDVTAEIPENMDVKKFVDEAYVGREKYFNRKWDEVIGFSEIKLTGMYKGKVRDGKSCWSRHIARMTREAADSEIGFQFDLFQGEEIPAGPIRYGDLIDNFPHFRKWGDKGWNVSRARVSGFVINQLLKAFSNPEAPLDATVDGVTVLDPENETIVPWEAGGKFDYKDALIDGENIENLKFYSVAMPSEIPIAMGIVSPVRDLLMRNLETVEGSDYWEMVENYLRLNSPLKCL